MMNQNKQPGIEETVVKEIVGGSKPMWINRSVSNGGTMFIKNKWYNTYSNRVN